LLTEEGKEVKFRGTEDKMEKLIRFAWETRALIDVFEGPGKGMWPSEVSLRRL